MDFDGLKQGKLLMRYKRFFADVILDTGETITAHCPNPGKMLGLLAPGTPALVSHIPDPKRKLSYRLEALEERSVWVGVNTQWPNRLIHAAVAQDQVPQLSGYKDIRPEVKYGVNSRIDLLLSGHAPLLDAFVEVKNVHLSRAPGLAEFPDCVTARGTKHLHELIEVVRSNRRAVVVFCIQRDDVDRFSIARDCDPGFAKAFDAARLNGVEFMALRFAFAPDGLQYAGPVPVA